MTNDSATSTPVAEDQEFSPDWGDTAPRGGRTVLNRVLKDGAKVPLFLGQTLVQSLRDLGYSSTTSAICEHVDNSIQWGATEVRVYFHQSGKRGAYKLDVLVLDNGNGMSPHVLKVATSFGGSMVFENREGIGRFGMGMKAAALSMSPVLDIYSWQEQSAFYNMTLDVEDIGRNKANLIELPDPELSRELPSDVSDVLVRPMIYPKNPDESQSLLATDREELADYLGKSGTIVFMPDCDRLTYWTAKSLVDLATKELGRVYRRAIERGVRIFVNNRQVSAIDPTYWMPTARHTTVPDVSETRSRLVKTWTIDVPVAETSRAMAPVTVRLYALPYDDWSRLPRKVLKNDLHVYDDFTVSWLRNDREVEIGASYRKLGINKHHTNNWLRLQIDFGGELDEACGVAANKQGVRPKDYVFRLLKEKIGDELSSLRSSIAKRKSEQAANPTRSTLSEAERRATDADGLQGKPLPVRNPETDEERQALNQNLRALAVTLKREHETDEEAFQRIKASTFITTFKHDEYWPFYHCDFQFGKVILTLNTAHAFFRRIWEPLSIIVKAVDSADEADGDSDGITIDSDAAASTSEVLVALQLLLLSLARTQGQMGGLDSSDEHAQLFERLRREWSANLETQLAAK